MVSEVVLSDVALHLSEAEVSAELAAQGFEASSVSRTESSPGRSEAVTRTETHA